jgi:hypothetical protein
MWGTVFRPPAFTIILFCTWGTTVTLYIILYFMKFITQLYYVKKSQVNSFVSNFIYNIIEDASLLRCDLVSFCKYFQSSRTIIVSFSLLSSRLNRTAQTVLQDNEDTHVKLFVVSMQYV